jgi:hypothetical protein
MDRLFDKETDTTRRKQGTEERCREGKAVVLGKEW